MNENNRDSKIEIWGGIECTINRVGNNYFDQLKKGGHYNRNSDLDLIAALGIKKLRYPVLWEMVAPNGLKKAEWNWVDERLYKLKELGITPIAGLLHHGSGPVYTNLADPDFPSKIAEFAYAVAERYPWLEYFTPVNEPLTTARFSGLYGFWYPHGNDNKTFARTLLNQCCGIIRSMQAIKTVIPNAKLIQTEDLGKTHSTKRLSYQADFENERRWASLDLIMGKINTDMPFIKYLLEYAGINEEELNFFKENKISPDILGINYYITSERYLDHRIEKYPFWKGEGNQKDNYVDVEVVRVAPNLRLGHFNILKEAHERYHLPLALTEVHLGCTREEQLRWFKEAYDSACLLKKEGINMFGITAWSLFGAHDWNSLLVHDNHHYEPGVFDTSAGKPRSTALAEYILQLNNGVEVEHEVLKNEGWWKRPESILFPDDPEFGGKTFCNVGIKLGSKPFNEEIRPILITGGTDTLGKAFAKICDHRAIPFVLLNRKDMDISVLEIVNETVSKYNPWAIINTAGFVNIDLAESRKDDCYRENTIGVYNLATVCHKNGIQLLTFSSDMVFNGMKGSPYVESDDPNPLNTYGKSKAESEKILHINPSALIVRTSSFFGPWDQSNFLTVMINAILKGTPFFAPQDQIISPTYVPDLVNVSLDLLIDKEKGIWHLTNQGQVSWANFALLTAEMGMLDTSKIKSLAEKDMKYLAKRPKNTALSSERGQLMPTLENAITRYLAETVSANAIEV